MSASLLSAAVIGGQSPDGAVQDWYALHQLLTNRDWTRYPLADLLGFAVYHCTVGPALQQEQEAVAARALYGCIRQVLAAMPLETLAALPLNDLCALAWLNTRLAAPAEPLLSLAALDQRLAQQALALPAAAAPGSGVLPALRYFSLRLPDAEGYLHQLLDHYFRQRQTGSAGQFVLSLGLGDGLAGELLGLMHVYRAGIQHPQIKQRVREGVRYLLSVKRETDFLAGHYSIFPTHIQLPAGEATFGVELSWSHGDLGQSVVLYGAQELLQDEELAKIAELVGLNTLLRTSASSTAVRSARFCQGAAGLAGLYGKLYQATRKEAYRKGYYFWLHQTRTHLAQELTAGLYEKQEGSLRHGLAGVALVLFSAITGQEPTWEAILR